MGAFTRIQAGLRWIGLSGRCAFSGWRSGGGAVVDDEAGGHVGGDVAGAGRGVKQRLAARGLVALFSVSHQGRCGMDTVSTQHRWSEVLEDDIYRDVVRRYAPHLPLVRTGPARAAMTALEIEGVCDNWIWTAGHDSLIVQAASKALDRLFPNLDEQYFLARQIGDDGFHAEFIRDYVTHRLGRDPIRQITDIVRIHWEALGDLPYRNIHSFFAWELHYELHILSRLHTERRTRRINDPAIKHFAEERVGPDEAVHRLRILDWWMRYYAAHSRVERAAIASQVIALDDEIQRRLNPYLQLRYQRSAVNFGADIRGKDAVYDNFRREVPGAAARHAAGADRAVDQPGGVMAIHPTGRVAILTRPVTWRQSLPTSAVSWSALGPTLRGSPSSRAPRGRRPSNGARGRYSASSRPHPRTSGSPS